MPLSSSRTRTLDFRSRNRGSNPLRGTDHPYIMQVKKIREEVFIGKIVRLILERQCIGEKTKRIVREKVYLPDSVNIFPITDKKMVRFIKERRWEKNDKPVVKIISGMVNVGESALSAAKRELIEETGLEAEKWRKIFTLRQNGTINQKRHYFIADHLNTISRVREQNSAAFKDYTLDALINGVLDERFGVTTSGVIIKLYNKLYSKGRVE